MGIPVGKKPKIPNGTVAAVSVVGAIFVACWYGIVKPLVFEQQKYVQIQKEGRAGIDQKKIQPGDMRVWSNPFKPLKNED